MRSSSGGMFVLLAQQVIERGGVVFGVVFDKEWQLHHVAASTMEDVYPMMGSKYVQSRIENTYNEARKYLREGRQVLFSGTSCQIAGLKTFLNKDYDNLLAVDVICHGTPSPSVWKRYLEEMKYNAACKAAAGKNTVLSSSLKEMPSIEGISFRDKYVSGWKKYCFVVWGSSAHRADENSVLSSGKHFENPFMRGFLSNIYLRPSCYACRAKGGACGSDITLADFWGIGNILPEMDDDKGASLVIPHTDKGRIAIEALRHLDIVEVPAEQALRGNPSYFRPVAIPNTRARFYESFMQDASVISLVERSLHVPRWRALSRRIKGLVKRVVKRIIGRK